MFSRLYLEKIWFQLKREREGQRAKGGWGGGRREAEIREKMAPYEEMRQFSFTLSKIPAHLFHGP